MRNGLHVILDLSILPAAGEDVEFDPPECFCNKLTCIAVTHTLTVEVVEVLGAQGTSKL
jgi:hypothetical protein